MSILQNKTMRAAALALALALAGVAGGTIIASIEPAQADDRRWRDRDDRRWRNNHWDRSDWRRNNPHYYTAPGYVYAPPPVVYAPQPVYPGFSFSFGF